MAQWYWSRNPLLIGRTAAPWACGPEYSLILVSDGQAQERIPSLTGTQPGSDAQAGLLEALRLDGTLAGHPERLHRALADLAPNDERGLHLLTLAASLGVPALLRDGHHAEAHAQLTDVGGCRTDVASWTVTTWAFALGTDPGPEPVPEEPPSSASDVPVEEPGAPTSVHLAVWPDDTPSVAIVTLEGAFVVMDARRPARGCWRRVATPRTPLSRDIALAVDAKSAEVVWSDRDGVYARALRRGVARPGAAGASPGGPPSRLGEVRCLATPPEGEQARYPLTALIISPGELEVVWSADRRSLLNAQARAWAPPAAGPPLPPACTGAERLACLDVAAETDRTAWLLCLTDHGRMLAARWDTALGGYEEWIQLEPPAQNLAALTVVCLQGRPMAIAVTADGSLLCLDARAAVDRDEPWHSIDRPDALRRSAGARALSAGSVGGDGWLALASGDGAWVVPIDRQGSVVRCGPAISLWLGN